jgi:predicted DNA-binding protein (UPF0251 family)
VSWRESLGGWLHEVCRNVCRKARRKLARTSPQPLPTDVPGKPANPAASELSQVLDDELRALPTPYREAVVLCLIEGLTVDEAAKRLKVSEGQIRGRLHRGREKLRDRLERRGVLLSISALVLVLGQASAKALPPTLAQVTAEHAIAQAAGLLHQTASASVISLTNEVVTAMSRTKFHLLLLGFVSVAVLGTVGYASRSATADSAAPVAAPSSALPPAPKGIATQKFINQEDEKKEDQIDERHGKIVELDAAKNMVTIETGEDGFKLNVEIGSATKLLCARKEVKVADLKVGMEASAFYKGDSKLAFKVEAAWPRVDVELKAVDFAKKTISFPLDNEKGIDADVTLTVRDDVEVLFDGIPVGLEDVPLKKQVSLELGVDKKTVAGIHAKGGESEIPAHVKSLGTGNTSIIVTLEASNEKADRRVEIGFGFADNVKVRLMGKDAGIADLKADMPVVLRLALDRRTITHVWAGAPEPKQEDGK